MRTAKDIMTTDVATVTFETSVKELAALLSEKHISGVPVIDSDRKVIGIVTESDLIDQKKKVHIPTVVTILDSVFYLENPDKMEQEIKKIAGTSVEDICSLEPVTINEDTKIDEIATIMSEQGIHTLPVLNDSEELVGIVGRKDIIKTIVG